MAKFNGVARKAGYVGTALGAVSTHSAIQEACALDADICTETKFVEWSEFEGEVVGMGAATSLTSYAATSILIVGLGVTGFAAIGLVIGITLAAGYAGSMIGKQIGKETGRLAYDISR